jgi:uncharacterized protein
MPATAIVEGWFTQGDQPALLGRQCGQCQSVSFPPLRNLCPNPSCGGVELREIELRGPGRVWSYTDAQYQPPPPYVPAGDIHVPFAIAAVELPEGLVVLGQVADGFGVDDLHVGAEVALVIERLHDDESGPRLTWRWRPVREEENAG